MSRTQPTSKASYISPDESNLPPDSILKHVKMSPTMKPPPHLLRIFKTYLKNEEENPQCEQIDFEEFGTKWLALFNYGAHEDHSEIPIMDWVEQVSKNPYRPVRLMRYVDGEYRCVALIPPIFDHRAKIMKNDDRDYFAQIAARQAHQTQGAHRTKEANGYIERNFTRRIEVQRRVLTDHFHQMNEIFEMYGVKREIPDWLVRDSAGELAPKVGDETQNKLPEKATSFSGGMIEED